MEWLVLLTLIAPPIHETDVDVLELNRRYEQVPNKVAAKQVLKQLIVWQYYPRERRYHVRAWRMHRGETIEFKLKTGRWIMLWRMDDRLVLVRAVSFRETWTLNDPEIDDRAELPVCRRMGL